MKYRIVAAVLGTLALLGFGATAALANSDAHSASGVHVDPSAGEPALAATGYDFTPMLVTAGVLLLISGIAVIVAKYLLARSRHS
ncbi:hypothetical protein [Herbiconiux ginsengi]|uniref:LPXTG-motif cell wall anchor domain-containing protein n=1 Tax=Herbiconiux ginsengi TaxID=381665 RepID=A0A1H3TRV6_9MICO|nr:hypothetical protein [Herbiconiux ginsengi]SDZ52069.1 hypothetical protein SAMN05216554_4366 [Herbiconiux ginsengi]